jgi:hypothetical protein
VVRTIISGARLAYAVRWNGWRALKAASEIPDA